MASAHQTLLRHVKQIDFMPTFVIGAGEIAFLHNRRLWEAEVWLKCAFQVQTETLGKHGTNVID